MKRIWENLKKCMLVLAAVFLLLPGFSVKASNEQLNTSGGAYFLNTGNLYWSYYPKAKSRNNRKPIYFNDYWDDRQSLFAKGWESVGDTKVTSSNPAVVTVKFGEAAGWECSMFSLNLKKPGRAKITITDKFKKGKQTKTVTKSFWVTSVKYENPFKGVMFDSTSYTSKYNKYCGDPKTIGLNISRLKSTVFKYSLKSNWTIQSVQLLTFAKSDLKYVDVKNFRDEEPETEKRMKTIKSGTRLKKGTGVIISLKNTKTKICEDMLFYVK